MLNRNLMLRAFFLALGLVFMPASAVADVFRVGNYSLERGSDLGTFELSAAVPNILASNDLLGLPDGCSETDRERFVEAVVVRYAIQFKCTALLPPEVAIITPWGVDGGTFSSSIDGSMVRIPVQSDGEKLILPLLNTAIATRPLQEIAQYYTWEGVLHILAGWDHLCFVLCLCLMARGRSLIALVTTFTLGHSLSLAFAFFEVVRVPVLPVEVVIALSISFMAREALLQRPHDKEVSKQWRRQLCVVAGFGLLHGLGFATVLRKLGVAPGERVSGLLFFNAGVELGQLMFVSVVVAVMMAARKFGQAELTRSCALYGAGVVGFFWVLERLSSFSGSIT